MGSSPLTRGKRSGVWEGIKQIGLIPAHAGKTGRLTHAVAASGAHPRSRGENGENVKCTGFEEGSSPLTRGKPVSVPSHEPVGGLIPAHAGKTKDQAPALLCDRAHPRSRGENAERRSTPGALGGSSPLTRGKPSAEGSQPLPSGLIPAHAGKTAAPRRRTTKPRAHPRSRGENWFRRRRRTFSRGSSPLTRGKRFLTCAFIAQIGQILESRELCASSESYSLRNVYATDAPPDQVRSIGLVPRSSRGAS